MTTPFYADAAVALYNQDWRTVLPTIPDGTVAAVATDPPYGIAYRSNKRVSYERFDSIAEDAAVDPSWVPESARALADGGALYVATRWDVAQTWHDAITDSGLTVKNWIVWHKPGGGMGDLTGSFILDYELILFAAKGKHVLRGKRTGSVWTIPKDPPSTYQHPTQKPVGLMNRIIEASTDQGDLVLDPFSGSGTTLVAAKLTGRRAIGCEIEPRYCAVAEDRLAQGVLF